jgi:hypothetical protein
VITIPADLEVIESTLFDSCSSLRQLIFEIPSRLRQLALPPCHFDPICIPDSVEVLSAEPLCSKSTLLQFGPESRLNRLKINSPVIEIPQDVRFHHGILSRPPPNRAFVRLHEKSLRRFRCEFESDAIEETDPYDWGFDDSDLALMKGSISCHGIGDFDGSREPPISRQAANPRTLDEECCFSALLTFFYFSLYP